MTAATDYLEAALLNHVLRNTAYTSPTTVYAGLSTSTLTDSADDSSAVPGEPSGNGYARQAMAFDAPSGGSCANSATETFGPNTSSPWGTITDAFLADVVSGAGNVLTYGALSASKAVAVDDSFEFAAGNYTVSLA